MPYHWINPELCYEQGFEIDLNEDGSKMKPRYSIVAAILATIVMQLLSLLVGTDSAPRVEAATPPGQVVFSLYSSANLSAVSTAYKLTNVSALFSANSYLATVPSGQDPAALANSMSGDAQVSSASANYGMSYAENSSSFNFDPSSFNFDGSSSASAYSNARSQWAWTRTSLFNGQKITWGQGVKVAVLDTGVDYNHPDLRGKVLTGYDAVTGTPDGRDVQGHGTFVAGVITQIAPAATILPVRVLDANGIGTLANVIDGLQYALDNGATVINLSLSSNIDVKSLHQMIQTARSKGVTVVSAAGNNSSSTQYFPAAYAEGIGIAATDNVDCRASFSNYYSAISLSGPGVSIYSMWAEGGYGWGNGTSFSTPMAAAGAAAIRSLHPTYSPDQVKSVLKKAVDGFGSGCKAGGLGVGRLNFSKIV
jgi:thermitase